MNNNNWLSDLASAVGLDSGTPDVPSNVPASSPDIYQSSNLLQAANTSAVQHSHPDPNTTFQLPLPEQVQVDTNSWEQHTTAFSHNDRTFPEASGLSQVAGGLALSNNPDVLSPHHHYNGHNSIVIGHPEEEMKHFYPQVHPDTCAIATQRSIIEGTTGQHVSEHDLVKNAQNHAWYQQDAGTPINNVGDLITSETGIPVEKHFGGSLAEIAAKIANGEHVMVSLNAEIANVPDSHSMFGALSSQMLDNAVHGNHLANHVEEVIGIEIKDGDLQHPVVIVNDPSSADGKGVEIPAEQFAAAWKTGGNFIASTVTHPETVLENVGTTHIEGQHLADYKVGCQITWYPAYKSIRIDGDEVGTYNGNTFYWENGSVAGVWSCDRKRAYSGQGKDLGYAPTWKDAALLIYHSS